MNNPVRIREVFLEINILGKGRSLTNPPPSLPRYMPRKPTLSLEYIAKVTSVRWE